MKQIGFLLFVILICTASIFSEDPEKNGFLGSWTLNCEFNRSDRQSGTFIPICPIELNDNSITISPMVVYFSSDSLRLQDTTVNYLITKDSLFFNYNDVEWKFQIEQRKKHQIRLWNKENSVLLERRSAND